MKALHLILCLMVTLPLYGQHHKSAYAIYTSKGEPSSYEAMLNALKHKELVLFGELHDNPIAHWLQLELAKDISKHTSLILGAEMLEADNQDALNRYLTGDIDMSGLDSLARLWKNFKTDYAPLVDFAKSNRLDFIATNIPRRLANKVYKEGGLKALDSLTNEEKAWIAPLPIAFDPDLPQYKKILKMAHSHGSPEFVQAQAIKDAAMAHFILNHLNEDCFFLHLNGRYHSDFFEGIVWYLNQHDKQLNLATISTVNQENIHELEPEHIGRADFIICVDKDMTKTY